jgi:hypothetical protein
VHYRRRRLFGTRSVPLILNAIADHVSHAHPAMPSELPASADF